MADVDTIVGLDTGPAKDKNNSKSPLPPNVSKRISNLTGRKRSWVWEHFTEIDPESSVAKRRAFL